MKAFHKIYNRSLFSNLLLSPIIFLYRIYIYNLLTEKQFIKKMFKKRLGFVPDLENPKTLSEKIQWLKLNDRTTLHTMCADKFKVREYVKDKIGEEYLVPLVFETNSTKDIRIEKMPDYPVIIKTNHDSGGGNIVQNKYKTDFIKIQKELKTRLKKNYYKTSKEWPYKDIDRLIIVEKLLIDTRYPNELPDYKIHCINHKVNFIEIMTDRSTGAVKEYCLDINFNKQPFLFSYPQSSQPIQKPKKWDEMIKVAEILSEEFLYVRVDLYDVNDEIFFGELTFHPHSGIDMYMKPREWDLKLGQELTLPINK